MVKDLTKFFERYIIKEPLFKNKKILTDNYFPNKILHRDNEIETIAKILAPALKLEKPIK